MLNKPYLQSQGMETTKGWISKHPWRIKFSSPVDVCGCDTFLLASQHTQGSTSFCTCKENPGTRTYVLNLSCVSNVLMNAIDFAV